MLLNKVRYFVEEKGWDVTVVTTDQHGRPSFYPFPEGVRMIDLGSIILTITGSLLRRSCLDI